MDNFKKKLYFFTAANSNPVYRYEAQLLIESGKRFGRDIHFYEIPENEPWHRYKVKIIGGTLPSADKYIYFDSDCILTGPGDWESDECIGVSDVLYWCKTEPERKKHTNGFMRNHTICGGINDVAGYKKIVELWQGMNWPIWCNSGVTVLPADIRLEFAEYWKQWLHVMDVYSSNPFIIGDEAALMFARHTYGLPLLPPRFNGMCKWQQIYDWHVLIHADGNVSGQDRLPYIRAVEKLGLKDVKK